MEKVIAAFAAVMLIAAPVAAEEDDSIDININLDLNLFGGDDDENNNDDEEENQTYGERVGGQSVHTEQQDSEAEVGRDSDDFQITEDTSDEGGFFSNLLGMIGLS